MKFKYIERGDYSKVVPLEKFGAYAGMPEDETCFYLHAAVQMVETYICKSLTNHIIHASYSCDQNAMTLPMGPVSNIRKIWRYDECHNLREVHKKCSRLVSDKLFLPRGENSWEIEYETCPVDIGPSEELVIMEVADKLLNGDKPSSNYIRKMLSHHKTVSPMFSGIRC